MSETKLRSNFDVTIEDLLTGDRADMDAFVDGVLRHAAVFFFKRGWRPPERTIQRIKSELYGISSEPTPSQDGDEDDPESSPFDEEPPCGGYDPPADWYDGK